MRTEKLTEVLLKDCIVREERLKTDKEILGMINNLESVLRELKTQLKKQIELRENDKTIK